MVDGWWWRGHNGAADNYKKQQSTNERRQGQRTTMAGKRQGMVVEAEERLLYRGRGFMVRSWRLECGGQAGGVFIVSSFLGRVKSYLNPTLYNLA